MLRNTACVLAVVSVASAIVPAYAQGVIEKKACSHGVGGQRTSGKFGGDLNLWCESSAERDAQRGATLFTRCIENPATNATPVFTHWKGVLGKGPVKPGERRYDETFVTNGKAEDRPRNTTLYYGGGPTPEPEQAICSVDVDICPGFFSWFFRRFGAFELLPMFSSAHSDGPPASLKDAIAEGNAEIDAYREFFVASNPANPDDLEKFAFRVKSRLEGAKLVYVTRIFASQHIKTSTPDGSGTIFRLGIEGRGAALPPFRGLEGFSLGTLKEAASPNGLQLKSETVDARNVTTEYVVVNVYDRAGEVAADFIVPVLRSN